MKTLELVNDRNYSTQEVAIMLGISEATVRSKIKKGELHIGHPVSNQGAFVVTGSSIYWYLRNTKNPVRYENGHDVIDLSDEDYRKYLLAAMDKCRREISAANTALRKEQNELNEIFDELFAGLGEL